MEEKNPKQESAQDIREILRKRRESLDRVRANLNTVDQFQRKFADENDRSEHPKGFAPLRTLESISIAGVKLISNDGLSLSIILTSDEVVTVEYRTHEALSSALSHWQKDAPASELQRVGVPPKLDA
jgi:hypothetical protein